MPRRTIRAGGGPTVYSFQDDWDPLANGMGYAFATMLNAGNEAAQIREQRAANEAASERAAADDARQDRSLTLQDAFRHDQLAETRLNREQQDASRRDQLAETQRHREQEATEAQQRLTFDAGARTMDLGRRNLDAARDERQHQERIGVDRDRLKADNAFKMADRIGSMVKYALGDGTAGSRRGAAGGTDQAAKLQLEHEQGLDRNAEEVLKLGSKVDPALREAARQRLLRRQGAVAPGSSVPTGMELPMPNPSVSAAADGASQMVPVTQPDGSIVWTTASQPPAGAGIASPAPATSSAQSEPSPWTMRPSGAPGINTMGDFLGGRWFGDGEGTGGQQQPATVATETAGITTPPGGGASQPDPVLDADAGGAPLRSLIGDQGGAFLRADPSRLNNFQVVLQAYQRAPQDPKAKQRLGLAIKYIQEQTRAAAAGAVP